MTGTKHLITLVILLALIAPGAAEFNRTSLLIDAPTAEAQPYGSLVFTASGSQRLASGPALPGGEGNFSFCFSPTRRLEVAVSAYTRQDFVVGTSYQLIDGSKKRPSLAVGVHDIGIHSYVSPIGHDNVTWPDEQYAYRPCENFSAFMTTSIPVGNFGYVHAGLGRGRYVGYGNRSQYMNSDYLVGGHHQWAVGLFGGAEVRLGSLAALALEADGRDLNAGVKAHLGPVSASLALTKIEGFVSQPKFQRVSMAVTYQANNLLRRSTAPRPPSPPIPQLGMITGRVVDARTQAPLRANVVLQPGVASGPGPRTTAAADESGSFALAGIQPGSYLVTFESPGYSAQSVENDVTPGGADYVEVALKPLAAEKENPPITQITPIGVAQESTKSVKSVDNSVAANKKQVISLILKPVYFLFDCSELTPQATAILEENARVLQSSPVTRVIIEGRTCELGTDEYNLRLGERRAKTAYDYLIRMGVSSGRLSCRSLGKSQAMLGVSLWTCRRCDFVPEQELEAR